MKWSTFELRKLHRTDNRFAYVCDCSDLIGENDEDLAGVSPVNVSGTFEYDEIGERYIFSIDIACHLTMLCAITLDEVDVPLNFHSILEFASVVKDDFTLPIEGTTIDLDPFIWAEIMVEKPMRVLSENAYRNYREEIIELDEAEKMADNPFAKLQKKN
ncbi:MAG TPA: hypothetical protein PLH02_04235 [Bacillota bacterium]|nr:hypothetical protein [Bacillota bacterium]HPF42720.1 hypothetical protein [Bacillota bacterium]HPJ85549.1 hypothetical protein [Bacillota bacterium]HPQ62061.1 hypothetical protein [Bacillota bacterium]HRX92398.1 hypothetical protein [Candidatus Izemoplasmatales bacterium]